MVEKPGDSAVPEAMVTAGQTPAHVAVHCEVPGAFRSASKTYTVKPAAFMKPGLPLSRAVDSELALLGVVGGFIVVGVIGVVP
jgi:hypothetical protein